MKTDFSLHKTHDGRYRITTFSKYYSWKLSLILMFRYGFLRWGQYIPPITDEAIHPSYYRGKLKILSGWDNWYGYDWFAGNKETDTFIKKIYEKHCKTI